MRMENLQVIKKTKLLNQYYDPFQVSKRINEVAFKLALLEYWKIHESFPKSPLSYIRDRGPPNQFKKIHHKQMDWKKYCNLRKYQLTRSARFKNTKCFEITLSSLRTIWLRMLSGLIRAFVDPPKVLLGLYQDAFHLMETNQKQHQPLYFES